MSNEKVINITSDNFESVVLNSKQPVLVDFWADWCGPCKMLGPVIDQIAEEHPQEVKVGKINVDVQADLASKYQVMSIPTVMLFNNGQIVQKVVGVRPKQDFENMINDITQ